MLNNDEEKLSAAGETKESPEMQEWQSIKAEIAEIMKLPNRELKKKIASSKDVFGRIQKIHFFILSNEALFKEYTKATLSITQYINAQADSLEEPATTYFTSYFKEEKKEIIDPPEFFSKKGGNQLGKTMRVKYKNEESSDIHTIQFFIKTHQAGSTSQQSSSRHAPVDAKELFIYKAFEYMGVGPKAHFFFNQLSQGGFYIATQDLSFSKRILDNDKKNEKKFEEFDKLAEDLSKKSDVDAAKGIASLDILSRIFCIRDATTNGGNFGRVSVSGKTKWKIIDFRIDSHYVYFFNGIFESFKKGNGVYSYPDGDYRKTVMVNKENMTQKMEIANAFMEELKVGKTSSSGANKLSFREAISQSLYDIVQYMDANHSVLGHNDLSQSLGELSQIKLRESSKDDLFNKVLTSKGDVGDLGNFVRGILQNFNFLDTEIKRQLSGEINKPSSGSSSSGFFPTTTALDVKAESETSDKFAGTGFPKNPPAPPK